MMTGRTGSGGGLIEPLSDVKMPTASLANVFVEWHQVSQQKDLRGIENPEGLLHQPIYAVLTLIWRGLIASVLGMLSVSKPLAKVASDLSASTGMFRLSTRTNLPTGRSWKR